MDITSAQKKCPQLIACVHAILRLVNVGGAKATVYEIGK